MSAQMYPTAKSAPNQALAGKAQEIRQLFADAPEMAKSALANALPALIAQAAEAEGSRTESAGRIGIRQGTVSELTVIAPFAPGGGWPGIHSPKVKDWIVAHQIPAEGWYVAHPDLTVAEAGRLKRTGKAVEVFLDSVG